MQQPYFEEIKIGWGEAQYPFDCQISDNRKKDFIINSHWHYYIEILYFLSGQAKVLLGGEWHIASKNDLVFINACEVHSITAEKGEDTRYIVLKFDPEILHMSKSVFEMKYILPLTLGNVSYQKIFKSEELNSTIIPRLMNETYNEFQDKEYGFELAVQTGICNIFLWVIRYWERKGIILETGTMLKEIDIQRFQKLFDYVDQNYSEDITSERAAEICNMSYSYFSRQFKKIMGKTFIEYLNHIRIREAEKLLMGSDMNVTQIAMAVGFASASYFIKQFRRIKGVTPKRFVAKG